MLSDRNVNFLIVGLILFFIMFYIVIGNTYAQIDEFKPMFIEIKDSVESEDWQKTRLLYSKVKETWKSRTAYWIAFNYAEGDFATFEDTLTRLESTIENEDKSRSIEELNVLADKWENFNKIVPKP